MFFGVELPCPPVTAIPLTGLACIGLKCQKAFLKLESIMRQ